MKITEQFLNDGKSICGGWNSKQLRLLGVKIPFRKGWKKRLIGKDITKETWDKFLDLKGKSKAQQTNSYKKTRYEKRLCSADRVLKKQQNYINSNDFLLSYEWRRVRMIALKQYGNRCQCCGASPKDGIRLNVDHIKPRLLYPELALSVDNLQILCNECNHGKGNWDMTDWREYDELDEEQLTHIKSI